ncbi:MAG: lipoyl domain-containing protein [Mycobacterium sp.]|nr:lipoyl domain-containing protein [Mycobacterium sp.]
MADFVIRIPRVSVAVAEAELVELLVGNGQHVEEGTPIYVIATDKAEQEVEAGASGTVQWTAEVGEMYDIGVEIGVITPGDDAGRERSEDERTDRVRRSSHRRGHGFQRDS